jgi:hypothetical protein
VFIDLRLLISLLSNANHGACSRIFRRAGWRPAVGWICAAGVGWAYLGHPLFMWGAALWSPGLDPPAIHTDSLFELVLAMLGMAGLRSFEKATGKVR